MAFTSGWTNIVSNRWCGLLSGKGAAKKILHKGDVIKCPPNTPHWHGASADTAFVQVAITGREKGETDWMEKVTDEEYNK